MVFHAQSVASECPEVGPGQALFKVLWVIGRHSQRHCNLFRRTLNKWITFMSSKGTSFQKFDCQNLTGNIHSGQGPGCAPELWVQNSFNLGNACSAWTRALCHTISPLKIHAVHGLTLVGHPSYVHLVQPSVPPKVRPKQRPSKLIRNI